MIAQVTRHWWLVGLRGLAAVLFGIAAFIWPAITLVVLIALFGAYALVDGVLAIVAAMRLRHERESWWGLLLSGTVGVIVGVVTFAWPGITAFALIMLIAAWAIITGVFEIVAAVRLRHVISDEWFWLFSGVLSILLGAVLAAFPLAGLLVWVWMIGAYAIIFGVMFIALALRLQRLNSSHTGTSVPVS